MDVWYKCQSCKVRMELPKTEFPGDLVCPKCGETDCVTPLVSDSEPRSWKHRFPPRATSSDIHGQQKWMVSARRNDGQFFYVHAWVSSLEEAQKMLDTFLRSDCTCAPGKPYCNFHKEMFDQMVAHA